MSRCATVLDFRTWPTGAKENIVFGEEEICKQSKRFKLNERELIRTFREFVKSPDVMPEKILYHKNTAHHSCVIKRVFSQMNIIVMPDMAAPLTETIKNIKFIRISQLILGEYCPLERAFLVYISCKG
ncbi:hypothetical protein PR048_013614, partial [Dryococelus australis]